MGDEQSAPRNMWQTQMSSGHRLQWVLSCLPLCVYSRHQPELLVPSPPPSISALLLFPKTAEKLRFPTSAFSPPAQPPRVGLGFLQMFVFSAADENIHYLVSCGGEGSTDLHFPS